MGRIDTLEWPVDDQSLAGYSLPLESSDADSPPQSVSAAAIFIVTLFWGLGSGFSSAFKDLGVFVLTGAMLASTVLMVVCFRGKAPLTAGFTNKGGWLVWAYVLLAVLSMTVNKPDLYLLRYVLLGVAFSVMTAIRQSGWRTFQAARWGFTLAGVLISAYHVPLAISGGVFASSYRLTSYTNSNSIALIATFPALSLLHFLMTRGMARLFSVKTFVLAGLLLICVGVVVATKSRTSAISLLLGAMVLVVLRLAPLMRLIAVFVAGFFLLAGQVIILSVGNTLSDLYGLNDKFRGDVWTMTGRLENWEYATDLLFFPNPILGAGPGSVVRDVGVVHNAILSSLCEVGVVGTLPLVLLIIAAIVGCIRHRLDSRQHFGIAVFCSALTLSISESTFVSYGNPASLLVLLGIASLMAPRSTPEFALPEAATIDPDEWSYGNPEIEAFGEPHDHRLN